MNKRDLVVAVARKTGLSASVAEVAVNSVLEAIKKNVKNGVQLVGFGSFSVGVRKARTGRNPQTGTLMRIKAANVVRFRAGAEFRKIVR